MKQHQTYLLILAGLMPLHFSSAHPRPPRCLQESWIAISTKTQNGACTLTTPLKLAVTEKQYPLLNGESFRVQYWQGGYTRTAMTTINYRHEIYDECSDRTLLREIVPTQVPQTVSYAVTNPNLSAEVDASYKLVPMTDSEAIVALRGVLEACRR